MARSKLYLTTRKPARLQPDAALLRLADKHAKAQALVDAAEAAPGSLSDEAFDRLCAKVFALEDTLLAQPSRTLEGLGTKAQIAARYLQSPEAWGWRTYAVLGQLVRDVMCLIESRRAAGPAAVVRQHALPSRP